RTEEIIGYRFHSDTLIIEALTLNVQGGNYRLALAGDCKMDSAMVDDWYLRGGPRKDWTTTRGDLLGNSNLARVAVATGLDACILPEGYRCSDDQAATLVEAIIGAVYFYTGRDMETVKTVMRALGIRQAVMFFPLRPD
ncbi:unnamed protein product, partial [Aureobasidium vineae]